MTLFRNLTNDENAEFRIYARMNYIPFSSIPGIWHPVCQEECVKMNIEAAASIPDALRRVAGPPDGHAP